MVQNTRGTRGSGEIEAMEGIGAASCKNASQGSRLLSSTTPPPWPGQNVTELSMRSVTDVLDCSASLSILVFSLLAKIFHLTSISKLTVGGREVIPIHDVRLNCVATEPYKRFREY